MNAATTTYANVDYAKLMEQVEEARERNRPTTWYVGGFDQYRVVDTAYPDGRVTRYTMTAGQYGSWYRACGFDTSDREYGHVAGNLEGAWSHLRQKWTREGRLAAVELRAPDGPDDGGDDGDLMEALMASLEATR